MDIFFTLDYELFLGRRPGTPEKCLIQPMSELSTISEKYGVKFTIFVDAAYLYRLSQLSVLYTQLKKDYELVANNIRKLEEEGHDIELHFHPQWLYSDYDSINNRWNMDLKHYKLSDIPKEELERMFHDCKSLLDGIIGRKTIAFRAGGYSLNSYDDYCNLLKKNGIVMDSSVNCHRKVCSVFQSYDYRFAPRKTLWHFDDKLEIEVENGILTEIPITISKTYLGATYLLKKRKLQKSIEKCKKWGDGVGVGVHMSKYDRIKDLLSKFLTGKEFAASIDNFQSVNLINLYEFCTDKKFDKMVIIGHPKEASPQSIREIDFFLQKVYKVNQFKTFYHLLRETK